MVEQIFGALFLAALFVPAAVVVGGGVLLAWPDRLTPHHGTIHHAPAAI
jgi:hypothetical protein